MRCDKCKTIKDTGVLNFYLREREGGEREREYFELVNEERFILMLVFKGY